MVMNDYSPDLVNTAKKLLREIKTSQILNSSRFKCSSTASHSSCIVEDVENDRPAVAKEPPPSQSHTGLRRIVPLRSPTGGQIPKN
jgi:hypothetical protein